MGVATDIVAAAGEVVGNEENNDDYEGSQFMRVRVSVDITKPLCRGRKIGLSNGDDSWVSFKYERLPNLCYWCGRLTHHDKKCSLWLKRKGSMKEGDKQFGSWLRASTPNPWKKTIVHVAGYEDDESSDTEAVPRAEQSTGVVDVDARGSVDPKQVHMECGGDACVHAPSEGEYTIERADQPAQGVLHIAPSREVSDSEIFNSPNCLVSVQVADAIPPNDFQVQLKDIDDEWAKYDQRAEENVAGSVAISGGVSTRVVDSAGFLKKLFHSAGSSKQDSVVQRVAAAAKAGKAAKCELWGDGISIIEVNEAEFR